LPDLILLDAQLLQLSLQLFFSAGQIGDSSRVGVIGLLDDGERRRHPPKLLLQTGHLVHLRRIRFDLVLDPRSLLWSRRFIGSQRGHRHPRQRDRNPHAQRSHFRGFQFLSFHFLILLESRLVGIASTSKRGRFPFRIPFRRTLEMQSVCQPRTTTAAR
jgi:hypothetical protein